MYSRDSGSSRRLNQEKSSEDLGRLNPSKLENDPADPEDCYEEKETTPSKMSRTTAIISSKHSLSTQIWACLSYGLVSVSLTVTQKTVFHTYTFQYPNFVTLLQILTSLCLMHTLRYAGKMDFVGFKYDTAKKVFPLAFMWWVYVVSGVCALRHLTVPMYSVLRRVTTLLVVVGEYLLFNKLPSPSSGVALLFMCIGAAMAGMSDLTYSFPGYAWVFICVVSTALYLLLIRKLKDSTGLNEMSLLYYNNILGFPLMLLFLVFGTSELSTVFQYPYLFEPSFMACLLFSASQAFVLNMCIFRCTSINSPLATSVTGQIKDIATTTLGLVLFGDVITTTFNLIGLCIGLFGGMLYSAVSYMNSVRAAKADKKDSN